MYTFIKILLKPIIYILFIPKIVGKSNTKHIGKAVVICNHLSMWDPLFVSAVFRRHINWMGKVELFKNKILGSVLLAVGSFPVKRGEGDLAAIRHAFKLLRKGELLGIFPEGTRIKNKNIRPFEPGTSMIALKNKAPVIPVCIKGDYKKFKRMKMIIGEPIIVSDYVGEGTSPATVAKATEFLENKLQDMKLYQ